MDAKEGSGVNGSSSVVNHKSNLLDDVVREKILVLMKSPPVIQQLKKYQSLRRNQFRLRCQVAHRNEKKSYHIVQNQCSDSNGQASAQKPSYVLSNNHSATFGVRYTVSSAVQPVTNPVIASATNTSVNDTAYCFSNGLWSKSGSAFTSFSDVSNSHNAV